MHALLVEFHKSLLLKIVFSAPWLRGADRVKLDRRMQATTA